MVESENPLPPPEPPPLTSDSSQPPFSDYKTADSCYLHTTQVDVTKQNKSIEESPSVCSTSSESDNSGWNVSHLSGYYSDISVDSEDDGYYGFLNMGEKIQTTIKSVVNNLFTLARNGTTLKESLQPIHT